MPRKLPQANTIKKSEYLNRLFESIAPRKVFLRAGYEFDGMWNCYNPDSYKAAFRHIALALKKAQADNVAMVWQSAAWPSPQFAGDRAHLYDHNDPNHISKWYPGDDVVDLGFHFSLLPRPVTDQFRNPDYSCSGTTALSGFCQKA